MRLLEALVFLPLAGGLHLALWAVAPVGYSTSASGGGTGRGEVTLAGAGPVLTTLSRTWRRPSQVTTSEPALVPPAPEAAEVAIFTRQAPPSAPRSVAGLAAVLPVAPPPAVSPEKPIQTTGQTGAPAQPRTYSSPPDIRKTPTTDSALSRLPPPHPSTQGVGTLANVDTSPAPMPPVPKRKPPSRPAPMQRASGGGTGQKPRSGRGGEDAVQSQNTAARNALQAKWGARIRRRVRRKLIYPRGASGTGVARVSLTIDRAGQLVGLRLVKSSGVAEFDNAALGAVRRAGRFPKAPGGLNAASYTFSLSLSFRP